MTQNVKNSDSAEFEQRALALWKADQIATDKSDGSAKALGAALNKLKDVCGHGNFQRWLKKNNIDRNRATYCMRVASGKHAKKAAEKKKQTVAEGCKRAVIELSAPMYERLALIAKAEGVELTVYVSNVVMEHAKAQEKAEAEIKAAIEAAEREREQAVEQEKANKARAEANQKAAAAKKKADAILATAQKKAAALVAAAKQKAAAATA